MKNAEDFSKELIKKNKEGKRREEGNRKEERRRVGRRREETKGIGRRREQRVVESKERWMEN